MKWMLLFLSALLLAPNFIDVFVGEIPVYDHKEKFDPALAYINSTDKLIAAADSIAAKNKIQQGSLSYAETVSRLIGDRFYHGFSQYHVCDNWIAAFGEKFFGHGLASHISPDNILKYSYGGCSQQSIVLMEAMKRKNIPYRSIGFPHHYAVELFINNNWYFFDPNMEPEISDSGRLESRWKCCADSLKKYYDTSRFIDLDWKFGKSLKVVLGKTNAAAAPNANIFQTTTVYLSKTLWLFPLMIAFYPRRRKAMANKQ